MSPSQHHHNQYKLTQGMPSAAERVRVIRHTSALADITERGDGFKEDGVEVEAWGWDGEGVALHNADEEKGDEDPPYVGDELLNQMGLKKKKKKKSADEFSVKSCRYADAHPDI